MYYDLNAGNIIIFSILHIFVIEWTLSEKDECRFHLGYSFISLAFLGRHQLALELDVLKLKRACN